MNQDLQSILQEYRTASVTEREKGTYFEELIITYLRYEAAYADLYSDVWTYSDWAKAQSLDGKDTGIDLVAKTKGTNEYHAIQCKFYAEDYRIQKSDIDSFFTASGKKPFTQRVIVTTTNNWSDNAEDALQNQQPPVSKIDLNDLENSQIDWTKYQPKKAPELKPKKTLRPHQENALQAVQKGLSSADRGKLIMACGTGKTFTALKIAETLAGKGKRVLFLVPSLSLLSQTLTEWTQESKTPLHSFAVCSDSDIGKKRKKDDDVVQTFVHELRYPATTDGASLAREMEQRHEDSHISIVFSTYHSIDVINNAQKNHNLADFDLIICDEAHRTTGATFDGEDDSNFVKIHDADFIKGSKRLYMTATPRIYGDMAEAKAEKEGAVLYSMNNEAWYGKELFVLTFSEAVTRGLLVDYKVIVLTVDEAHISSRLQKLLADEDNQLKVDDAAKIVGCWKALSKQYEEDAEEDADPMRRAVAFCQVIEPSLGKATHKVSSKNIANMFQAVVEAYQEKEDNHNTLYCEAEHIDGSMNASAKEEKLSWLKAEPPEETCRILSNVRCLSEGVDVPALDAVLFLTPRNSQVDVVQSVGRIMRNAPNKERGYVILPVVIPTGVEPHEALNDNKTYKVVWDVLQALRSHDDRFDAMINKLDLIGKDHSKMEVIAITDKIAPKQKKTGDKKDKGKGSYGIGAPVPKREEPEQHKLQFEVGEIEKALYAKLVKKCGNRRHWELWANDIAKIANTHIARITAIVSDPENKKEVKAFTDFADELRDDLNDAITNDEVIEMLAQHLITKPVFDALFEDYSFATKNPVSQAMQHVLDVLQEHRLDKEADTLEKFYSSVKMRAEGINTAEGKQKIVVELYDKFFRNAFPKMTEKLGIVYTPVEVVDFIIHSVNDVLQEEFGQSLGSKGVHIIDPFTGTGTFITRLLQSGLIKSEELANKYKNEIHANEIVLLAYYIAAINIEASYHGIAGGDYEPFEGICLTDTFRLGEKDLISDLLADNSERRKKLQELDIRVIMGNPPYSAGQTSANDDNANVAYDGLDGDIRDTYAKYSSATNKNSLYDSYIRAFRWASDRLGNKGVLGYVTNAGWLDGNVTDGMRKCLAEEYSNIYIFHLRGNARTSGEIRRKEKDNVFGQGTRTPISITLLVKNPEAKEHGKIYFHDIGDYLSQQEKLDIISDFVSIKGIKEKNAWQTITPDKHSDWVNQRDDSFDEHMLIGAKKVAEDTIFPLYSRGLETNRDAWCYNYSSKSTFDSVNKLISFYNSEVTRFKNHIISFDEKQRKQFDIDKFIDKDPTKISWNRSLKKDLSLEKEFTINPDAVVKSLYRPFSKQWAYFDKNINAYVNQLPAIYSDGTRENLVITVNSNWTGVGNIGLISNVIPDLHFNGDAQCFPLKIFGKTDNIDDGLFAGQQSENISNQKDGISDKTLRHFKEAYPNEDIAKEDIFYYIYGLLHSEDYLTRYADNLSKQLPRIPCVKTAADFWTFTKAGRDLADLHVNYETVVPYDVEIDTGGNKITSFDEKEYYVTKMKFAKKSDKSKVIYNNFITIKEIPLEAYEYVVNGKPALEWVMERQGVKEDKKSGIVNDANQYAIETVGDAAYPLKLFQRVITVSLETMKIVKALPKLEIQEPKEKEAA